MEDVSLVIPTHARPTRQITYTKLTRSLQNKVIFVTSTKTDYKAIADTYPAPRDIIVAPPKVTCIAEKRHWIMNNILAHNIFMMDDDLQFFHRCDERHRYWDGGQWRLHDPKGAIRLSRTATRVDLERGFKNILGAFNLYGAVGMSFRRHNDKVQTDWRYNERLMFAFGINRETYRKLKIRFDAVRCREDFHITLALLERGVANAVYYNLYHNPGDFGAPGGASTERSLQQSNEQAYILQELHPEFVRCEERTYATSPSRVEVTVQWKKAYAKSQEVAS